LPAGPRITRSSKKITGGIVKVSPLDASAAARSHRTPTRLGLEGEQVSVARAADDLAVFHGDAAVLRPVLAGLRLPVVPPPDAARRGVEGDRGLRGREVQHSAVDDGVRVERAQLPALIDAHGAERGRVLGGDLRRVDEAPPLVVVVCMEPVRRIRERRVQLRLRRALLSVRRQIRTVRSSTAAKPAVVSSSRSPHREPEVRRVRPRTDSSPP